MAKTTVLLCLLLTVWQTAKPVIGQEDQLVWDSLHALHKLIDFFKGEALKLNVDGLFGIRLCQSHIRETLVHPKANLLSASFVESLQKLDDKIEDCANLALPQIRKTNPAYYGNFSNLIDNPVSLPFSPREFAGGEVQAREDPGPVAQGDNTYDEAKGDRCLNEVLTTKHECRISQDCWDMMGRLNTHRYKITHTLLFIMFAEKYGCKRNLEKLSYPDTATKLEDKVCYNILRDHRDLRSKGTVRDRNRDLYLEEALLCGTIGFKAFLTREDLKHTLSWQDPVLGCYKSSASATLFPNQGRNLMAILKAILRPDTRSLRTKRKSVRMQGGCEAHYSGLASGVLGLFIRAQLDAVTMSQKATVVRL